MAILGSFLQYVIIMAILVLLAVLGVKLGVKLRKNKDAKEAAVAATMKDEDSAVEKEE